MVCILLVTVSCLETMYQTCNVMTNRAKWGIIFSQYFGITAILSKEVAAINRILDLVLGLDVFSEFRETLQPGQHTLPRHFRPLSRRALGC